jgi:hypothetical protein
VDVLGSSPDSTPIDIWGEGCICVKPMASYRWVKGLTLLRRSERKEELAMARVDEVGDRIYRISTTVGLGAEAFQFN